MKKSTLEVLKEAQRLLKHFEPQFSTIVTPEDCAKVEELMTKATDISSLQKLLTEQPDKAKILRELAKDEAADSARKKSEEIKARRNIK